MVCQKIQLTRAQKAYMCMQDSNMFKDGVFEGIHFKGKKQFGYVVRLCSQFSVMAQFQRLLINKKFSRLLGADIPITTAFRGSKTHKQ